MKQRPGDRFSMEAVRHGDRAVRALIIRCSKCQRADELHGSKGKFLPTSEAVKKFRLKGWHVGRSKDEDMCNACAAMRKHVSHGVSFDALTMAKPDLARPVKVDILEMKDVEEGMADTGRNAPRQPSVADRRKIMDALEQAYDPVRSCYRGTATDQALADRIGVPRIWLSEIREQFFGPEKNEAASLAAQELEKWVPKLLKVEQAAMALAAEAETYRNRIEELLRVARS